MTFLPERTSLDRRPVPRRYTNAKLDIFVHWCLYSIPALAEDPDQDFTAYMRELTAGKGTRGRSPYATFGRRSSAMPRRWISPTGLDRPPEPARVRGHRNAQSTWHAEWFHKP